MAEALKGINIDEFKNCSEQWEKNVPTGVSHQKKSTWKRSSHRISSWRLFSLLSRRGLPGTGNFTTLTFPQSSRPVVLTNVLQQKGVGMHEPLVDCEGYPRSDVDVYQVRTARHNIVCLQNDHKAVMKQVEEALHQLHARDKEKQARDMAEAHQEAMSRSLSQSEGLSPPQAFAKVNSISPGSPASTAGLQVDDEIVEFGSVNSQNFQSLQNIGSVVQHSEGRPLNVTVIRRGERHQLRLVPARWAGKGLLGCNIIPLQR